MELLNKFQQDVKMETDNIYSKIKHDKESLNNTLKDMVDIVIENCKQKTLRFRILWKGRV